MTRSLPSSEWSSPQRRLQSSDRLLTVTRVPTGSSRVSRTSRRTWKTSSPPIRCREVSPSDLSSSGAISFSTSSMKGFVFATSVPWAVYQEELAVERIAILNLTQVLLQFYLGLGRRPLVHCRLRDVPTPEVVRDDKRVRKGLGVEGALPEPLIHLFAGRRRPPSELVVDFFDQDLS